jgi:F-type H+-transporting ATPase subunit c
MKNKIILSIFLIFIGVMIFAQNAESNNNETNTVQKSDSGTAQFFTFTALACVLGLGLAATGCALGQGIAISKALEGISRQPEASGKIQTVLLIGLAFIESVVIYVLVVVLILLFANPFIQYL